MNDLGNGPDRRQHAAAISIWENEGGATGRNSMDNQYGRRIEPDRSWTVDHVFTGVPARCGGDAMIGLSQSDATDGTTFLNLRNAKRRNERDRLSAPSFNACEIVSGQS